MSFRSFCWKYRLREAESREQLTNLVTARYFVNLVVLQPNQLDGQLRTICPDSFQVHTRLFLVSGYGF